MGSPQIYWGAGLETPLDIAILDTPIPFRQERPGSEYDFDGAGSPISWREGWDYYLAAEIRSIPRKAAVTNPEPATAWSGPTGVQEFIVWALSGNTFRLVPDRDVPGFFVDGCSLREPPGDFRPEYEQSTTRFRKPIVISHPTVDLGMVAIRGIMFEYAPGVSLIDPVVATFTRASAGTRRGKPGPFISPALGATDAVNVLRDRHYEGAVRHTLLEGERIQLITSPQDFSAWTNVGTPVVTAGQADAFGGTGAYLIEDDNAAGDEGKAWTVTGLSGNGTKSGAVLYRQGTATASTILWWVGGAAIRLLLTATWTAGVPSVAVGGGSGTIWGTFDMGAGWWLTLFSVNSVVVADANVVRVLGALSGNTPVGSTYYNGMNVWNDIYPATSFQPTAIATRSADSLSWPHLYAPQPTFMYYRGVWRSGLVDWTALMVIGQFVSGVGQRLIMHGESGGNFIFNHGDSSSSVALPAAGDVIELLGYVDSLGRARIIKSVNGGAESAGALSGTTEAFPAAYTRQLFDLGHEGASAATHRVSITAQAKYGPFTFGGRSIDTIAKARAV